MATTEERLKGLESGIGEIKAMITADARTIDRPGALQSGAPAIMREGMLDAGNKPFGFYNFLMKALPSREWATARHEREVCDKFRDALVATGNMLICDGSPGQNGLWLPTNLNNLPTSLNENPAGEAAMRFVKSAMQSTHAVAADPDELNWLAGRGFIRKAANGISAYQDGFGGTLVAPPTMGPVVELIRPEAALLAAGATQIPLPPSGRYVEPRITGAPGATAVGETQLAIVQDMTTDQIIMNAKKIVGAVRITDEATMFTSGSLDTYARMELNRTLGLKIDNYGFYGAGGNLIPAGLTSATYSAAVLKFTTTYPTMSGIGTNGNTLLPQYGDLFEGAIAERSFGMDGQDGAWVMRPGAFAAAAAYRADAVLAGDKAGPKVDILRRFNEQMPTMWGQKKVVRTTNIYGNTTKGSSVATLSDVFYGIWKYFLIGTYGAVSFKEGWVNDDLLRGQKTTTATMYGDVGNRHPDAFGWYDFVLGIQAML